MSSNTKVVRPISVRPQNKNFSMQSRAKLSFLVFLVFTMALASLPFGSARPAEAVSVNEIDLTPPRPPMNLVATASDQKVKLEWTSVDQFDVNEYKIYIRSDSEQAEPKYTKDNSLEVSGLDNGKLYYFSVTALDSEKNESKVSNEIGLVPSTVKTITQKPYTVAAWMPTNWDVEDSFEAFNNNLDVYDIVSPFWFDLNPDGTLSTNGGARDKALIKKAQDAHVKVIPSITNNYSTEKAAQVLKSPGSILNHIDIVVKEVLDNGYDGIDIDYENVDADQKEMFTFFMRNLANQLHEKGKLLTITSQPKLSDHYTWNGPGAIDWNVAGEVADYLRVMNYDYSRPNTSPGPIAPKDWLRASMAYALKNVPSEKILGGVPFYGYDWALTPEGETSGLVWDGVQNTVKKYGINKIYWDEDAGESWYEYSDENGARKAYFNDARSIEEKLKVMTEEGVGGITIWRLGSQDPAIFDLIRKYLGKEGKLYSPANIKVVPKNHSIKVSWESNTNDSTAVGHYIYMGPTQDTMVRVADIKDASEYVASGLEENKKYFMRVTAYNARGVESEPTNLIASSPTSLVTAAPISNLKRGGLDASSVAITWSHDEHPDFVGNILDYDIRYSKEEINEGNWFKAERLSSDQIRILADGTRTFTISDLTPDTKYSFAVKTIDAFGQSSSLSNVVAAKTLDISPPQSPEDVTYKKDGDHLVASWKMGNDYDLAGYKLYYEGADHVVRSVYAGMNDSLGLDFLNDDEAYSLYVVALDNAGNESARSESRRFLLSEMQ